MLCWGGGGGKVGGAILGNCLFSALHFSYWKRTPHTAWPSRKEILKPVPMLVGTSLPSLPEASDAQCSSQFYVYINTETSFTNNPEDNLSNVLDFGPDASKAWHQIPLSQPP